MKYDSNISDAMADQLTTSGVCLKFKLLFLFN